MDVQPVPDSAVATPPVSTLALPLSPEDAKQWRGRIAQAISRSDKFKARDEACLKDYAPGADENIDDYANTPRTNRNFADVERALSELFYQKPDITCEPSPLLKALPGGADVASTHGAIVNEKLGLDGVNVKLIARRALFDWKIFARGWTVLGYRSYSKTIEQPVTDQLGMPVVDPITQTPMTAPQPVIVKSECFIESVSPRQVLIPAEFTSIEFDKANWLGWRFEMARTVAARLFNLPPDFQRSGDSKGAEITFEHGDQADKLTHEDTVSVTQLWYKTAVYNPDEIHPDALTELVLIDGIDDPVRHEPSSLQSFDERGRLTPDSLVGFPLHCAVLRVMTDAAYLPSDVWMSLPLVHERDKYREQWIRNRDANLIQWLYNTDVITKDILDKAMLKIQNGCIGIPGDAFNSPSAGFKPMERAHVMQEDFTINGVLSDDLAQIHSLDATAHGVNTAGSTTATESSILQANRNISLGWQQGIAADWYVQLVTKFSCVLQKFLTLEDAAAIVGQERAQLWDTLRKQVPARFAFSMTPDSSLRNDTPLDRKMSQDLYSFTANDPNVNKRRLLERVFRKYHIDPNEVFNTPEEMPKPSPPPSDLTVAVKDLPILNDPMAIAWINANPQWGIKVPPEVQQMIIAMAAQPNQTEHGGKVAQVESLDKHAAEETGGMQGSGAMMAGLGATNPLQGQAN